jgi:hypothetical protein
VLLFSVIHPVEYEKRLIRFLFEKVFINSNQTLDELLASPILPDIPRENQDPTERRESFEIIETTHVQHGLTTRDIENTFTETTTL